MWEIHFWSIHLETNVSYNLCSIKRSRPTLYSPNSKFTCIGEGVSVTVYPKKYAHGFCFAVLCCGYTLTDFPISIRLTSLALWQSNDCPSASKATLMNMDKYFMWIHYERLHNHNKAKHNKTVCIFLGIYCSFRHCSNHHIFKRKISCADLNKLINSLGPNDAMWQHRSGLTLAQVMACCLTAPSHYLNHCWFLISKVPWHSPVSNFTVNARLLFCIITMETILLKLLPHLPGANESAKE